MLIEDRLTRSCSWWHAFALAGLPCAIDAFGDAAAAAGAVAALHHAALAQAVSLLDQKTVVAFAKLAARPESIQAPSASQSKIQQIIDSAGDNYRTSYLSARTVTIFRPSTKQRIAHSFTVVPVFAATGDELSKTASAAFLLSHEAGAMAAVEFPRRTVLDAKRITRDQQIAFTRWTWLSLALPFPFPFPLPFPFPFPLSLHRAALTVPRVWRAAQGERDDEQ